MIKSSKFVVFFLLTLFVAACDKDPEPEPNNGDDPPPVTVQKYTVGSYYEVNGIKGVVYEITSDSLHGKIISLDEALRVWSFNDTVATGASDIDDGEANMTIIKNLGTMSDYPAFAWCNAKNSNGVTGWYLPASNEVFNFVRIPDVRNALNETLPKYQGTAIREDIYWSSTELSGDAANMAMIVDYNQAQNTNTGKNVQHYVRAVRKF